MARLTPEERLEQLLKKESELKARISREKSRVKSQERKDETRRKILLGSFLLSRMEEDDNFKNEMMSKMNRYLTADRDRELFGFGSNEGDHHDE